MRMNKLKVKGKNLYILEILREMKQRMLERDIQLEKKETITLKKK